MSASGKSDQAIQLPTLEDIGKVIEEAMEADLGTDSQKVWTKHIFEKVGSAKPEDDRIVPRCRFWGEKERGEYLIDLVWTLGESKKCESYRGFLLALECEWKGSEEGLWKDFAKLADVRADLKVFVGAANVGVYAEHLELLKGWATYLSLHRHTCKSERILVALCDKRESKIAEHGSWILDGEGKVAALREG